MFYLNRLFSGRSLKTILLISCFILIALAIWYLGPFVGFGKTRPLLAMHTRVAFILLAVAWLARFFWRIPFFLLVSATLCVLIWEIGPFILMGETWPLAKIIPRFILIATVVFLTLLYAGWVLLLALSRNPHLLNDFHKFRKGKPEAAAEAHEVAAVIRDAAVRTRKVSRGLAKWRHFFIPVQDTLPWYMVIGRERAGKTSLIASSGQDFPLPEQLARVTGENPPTAHCECWFANDALFIDTAGRFVTSENSPQPEWDSLLNAIGKYRPIKAINGVIVAISAAEIMGATRAAQRDIAAALRGSLHHIRTVLGVRFPVYVTITQMDRLAGFEAYFRDLTVQARERIWGVTFPYGEKTNATVAEQNIEQEMQILVNRIDGNISQRQQEEYAIADRRKMYALAQDFRVLAKDVAQVVQNTFFASRYDETQFYSTLRGIYFASARQSGDAPVVNKTTLIQRWRQTMRGLRDADEYADEAGEKGEKLISGWNDRHYFLKQLFTEVIVKDAGLVRYNLQAARRTRLANLAGHALWISLSFWLMQGMMNSYDFNSRYLTVVEHRLSALEHNASDFVKNRKEQLLPHMLAMSQTLAATEQGDVSNPQLSWRYGLYTGFHITHESATLYKALLHRLLLPQVEQQVSIALHDALTNDEPEPLYNALKLYLMIYGEGKFDRSFVEDELSERWDQTGKMEGYGSTSTFIDHLRHLFGTADWRIYGQSADRDLIRMARSQLSKQLPEERIYEQVKALLSQDAPPNVTLSALAGEEGGSVFTLSDDTMSNEGIPGLYTLDGYYDVVKKKGFTLVSTFGAENAWVMGQPTTVGQDLELYSKVLAHYLSDYTDYWRAFLTDVHLAVSYTSSDDASGLSVDLWLLRTLASSPSPLTHFAREVARQTTLSVQEETASDVLNITNRSQTLSRIKKFDALLARQEKKLVRAGVDDRFTALHEFVRGGGENGGVTPLNRMMALLNEQYTVLVMSKNALENGDAASVSEDGKKLLAEAQTWPDPFREMVEPLLANAFDTVETRQVTQQSEAISSGLGEVCRTTLEGKYPFAESEREVTPAAFTRFFAAGGLVDDYFTKNLANKVDTSSTPWRYKGSAEHVGLAVFEQAAEIRNAFFQDDDGHKLSLDLTISVPYLDPSLLQLMLDMNGEKYKYAHGPVTSFYVKWPGVRPGIGIFAKPIMAAGEKGGASALRLQMKGAWAIFRLKQAAVHIEPTVSDSEVMTLDLNQRRVDLEVSGLRYADSNLLQLLRNFHCPGDQ